MRQIGPYRVLEVLDEGAMGVVYRAEQIVPIRREVAIKVPAASSDDQRRALRFEIEKRALAALKHPHVVEMHDAGELEDGCPYLVLELVSGEPITGYARRRALSTRDRVALFVQVCDGLFHAHQKAILHRNLKPENLLVSGEGREARPTIVDFGLAAMQRDGGGESATRTGELVGAPEFMSPEQASGTGEIDVRSEVFSLGVILHELLTDRHPFVPDAGEPPCPDDVLRAIREDHPPPPSRQVEVEPELDWIVGRALEKDPMRRYPTVRALGDDLVAFLEGRTVTATPYGSVRAWGRFLRRHRLAVGTVAATILLLACGLVASLTFAARSRAHTRVVEETGIEIRKRIEEIHRLSDREKLAALVADAEALFPPFPGERSEIESWLHRAEGLVARLPGHSALLGRVERDGIDDPVGPWFLENLVHLVRDVTRFAAEEGLLADVRSRLGTARRLSREHEGRAELWDRVREALTDSPTYSGIDLPPQVGLVPLGADPETGLQEFADTLTGEPPLRDAAGKLVVSEDTGLVFVLIPGGVYSLGSPAEDGLAAPWERPEHPVALEPYLLSKYEMTQGQWVRVTGANPAEVRAGGGLRADLRHPVESVSWEDCRSALRRVGLTLPTEAQWEAAARAGTATSWWTGSRRNSLIGAANLADRSAIRAGATFAAAAEWPEFEDGHVAHAPVGTFPPNPFGLHEVLGNVGEWCRDFRGDYSLPVSRSEGERLLDSPGSMRIHRGAHYAAGFREARSAARSSALPGTTSAAIGVRPLRGIREAGR